MCSHSLQNQWYVEKFYPEKFSKIYNFFFDKKITEHLGLELKDSAKVEELRLKTLQSLHKHCATSSVASDRPNYLQKILAELPEIQKTAQPGAQRLLCFKLDGLISPTPTLDRILMNVGTQVMQEEFNKLRQLNHEQSRKKIIINEQDTSLSIACHS